MSTGQQRASKHTGCRAQAAVRRRRICISLKNCRAPWVSKAPAASPVCAYFVLRETRVPKCNGERLVRSHAGLCLLTTALYHVAILIAIAAHPPSRLPSLAACRCELSYDVDEGAGGWLPKRRYHVKLPFFGTITDILRLHIAARTPALTSVFAQWHTTKV